MKHTIREYSFINKIFLFNFFNYDSTLKIVFGYYGLLFYCSVDTALIKDNSAFSKDDRKWCCHLIGIIMVFGVLQWLSSQMWVVMHIIFLSLTACKIWPQNAFHKDQSREQDGPGVNNLSSQRGHVLWQDGGNTGELRLKSTCIRFRQTWLDCSQMWNCISMSSIYQLLVIFFIRAPQFIGKPEETFDKSLTWVRKKNKNTHHLLFFMVLTWCRPSWHVV